MSRRHGHTIGELPVLHVSKGNVKRLDLPQIESIPLFEAQLHRHGVRYRGEWLNATHLRPMQNEISLLNVIRLISAGLDTRRYPIILSRDHEILDGHHRAWAGRILNMAVYTIVVDLEHRALMKVASDLGAHHDILAEMEVH